MALLTFLEKLRFPAGDAFFSSVTHLGEETFFIVFGLLFFWCVSKKEGYYLLSVGLIGTVVNQFLKLLFRIPRPWVRDKSFTIVESARAEATGYSFPSGHTQSSVGVFGGIARWSRRVWVRIVCVLFCVLIPFSRLYLGVHTPLDVGVSAGIALLLVFAVYPFIQRFFEDTGKMRCLFAFMLIFSAAYLVFVSFYRFPPDTDAANLQNGVKNAYVMLGCIAGLWISFEADRKWIQFSTEASLPGQIVKLVLGILLLLGVKSGLKAPLNALFGGHLAANGVRYLLLVLFAGCIWPLTFRLFAKIPGKRGKSNGNPAE